MRIGSTTDIHELLIQEDDIQKVFDDTESYLIKLKDKPNDLICILDLFFYYGLPSERIKEFVNNNLSDAIIESIVNGEPAEWEKYGIFPKEYVRKYLENNIEKFLRCYSLKTLPQTITPDAFLQAYALKEIINICDFKDFYENFKESGGDTALLCGKYLNEIGYRGNPDDTLLLIAEHPELFDFAEFIRNVDVRSLTSIKLNEYMAKLRSVNASDDVLCMFYRYA